MKTQNHDRLGDKMTFRSFLTGCWLAVCVPIIGFSVGLAIDRRFRHEEY